MHAEAGIDRQMEVLHNQADQVASRMLQISADGKGLVPAPGYEKEWQEARGTLYILSRIYRKLEAEKFAPERSDEGDGKGKGMKFTIEITEHGYTETLETGGRIFRKQWIRTDMGFRACDKDLCDQLAAEGIHDEELLEDIHDVMDDPFFGMDLYKLERKLTPLLNAAGSNGGMP